jgi:hypothetical protein
VSVTIPWFEVEIPSGPEHQVLADRFLKDYCSAHALAGRVAAPIQHKATQHGDQYLLPPEGTALYFLQPNRSALADWLIATRLARAYVGVPDESAGSLKLQPSRSN